MVCVVNGGLLDPLSMSPQKGLELIGNNLQKQYERWQPRARYKQLLDPTTEEVRKLCLALRKNARVSVKLQMVKRTQLRVFSQYERVLFHYNGHGVPKPTQNGEIWVFNKVQAICVLVLCFQNVSTEFSFLELHSVYSTLHIRSPSLDG